MMRHIFALALFIALRVAKLNLEGGQVCEAPVSGRVAGELRLSMDLN